MRRPSSAWLSPPELLSRHGAWLDGGPGRAEDFVTEDVEVRSPRAHLQGRPAVAAFLEETAREQTQHLLTDVVVELDGDRAQVEANQLVQFVRAPGAAPHRSSGLRLRHTVVRTPAGWRMQRCDMELRWLVGDLPAAPRAS